MNFIGRAEQKEVEFEHPEPFHAGDLHLEPEESLPDRSKPKEALLLTVCPLSLCKLPRQSFYHPGSKSCGMRSICLVSDSRINSNTATNVSVVLLNWQMPRTNDVGTFMPNGAASL